MAAIFHQEEPAGKLLYIYIAERIELTSMTILPTGLPLAVISK